MITNIGGFIKIGAGEHIIDLYENGTIYCNTIHFFKECDERDGRGDPFEGIARLRNISNISRIEIHPQVKSKPPISLKTVGGLQIKEFYEHYNCNLYCLYYIKSDKVIKNGVGKVDSEYKKLGSHFLLIREPQRFLDLITGELNANGYRFRHGPVEFYNEMAFDGELTPFDKRKKFEYQNEFRFVIDNTVREPLVIRIGSLKHLAMIFESSELDKMEFRPIV